MRVLLMFRQMPQTPENPIPKLIINPMCKLVSVATIYTVEADKEKVVLVCKFIKKNQLHNEA